MATDLSGEHPPAKRRKIEETRQDANSHSASPPHPAYITHARVKLVLDPVRLETRSRVGKDVKIFYKPSPQEGDDLVIGLSASWLKHSVTVFARYDPVDEQILKDCEHLTSITSVKNYQRGILPAHYNATIDSESGPHVLSIEILWRNGSDARDNVKNEVRDILYRYSTNGSVSPPVVFDKWDVQEFYQYVHVPEATEENNAVLKIDQLDCDLYPFQQRAVRWLLQREGVKAHVSGAITQHQAFGQDSVILRNFEKRVDVDGNTYLANLPLSVVCSDEEEVREKYGATRGGLLCEAMGLGKTVEMIALMSLHNMQTTPLANEPTPLRRSGATLIITPLSILEQWQQEIRTHAPSLKVFHYQGLKSKKSAAMIDTLLEQDVVLTTYSIIAKEIHYVMEQPDRNLRDRPRQARPKSPLDQILWWRVCLDEAQMIESGVSAAAQVARMIPRVNAWAVTGTPLKQSHKDLFGLLLFLQVEPWCVSERFWSYLVTRHRPLFRSLMGEMAIRHSKEFVRDELRLPPQNRHTITISFSNIEQAHYSQLFFEMYNDCGLDRTGSPRDAEWDPNDPKTTVKMRSWLTRLRQTCVHPEVGGRNRKALGRSNGPLRSVQQVLEVMIDQTDSSLRSEQKEMLICLTRQGQILENLHRRDEALEHYQKAYDEANRFVDECRKAYEAEVLASNSSNEEKTKVEERDSEERVEADSDDEDEDEDIQNLTARQRLRSALEVKHICIFFMGNIYFQLKSIEEEANPQSTKISDLERQETKAYEEAKEIRGELLTEVVRKVNRKITSIKLKEQDHQLVMIPSMDLSLDDYIGIESRKIFDKLYDFCEAMNKQSQQLQEVRDKMMKFLQQGLIDEDEGAELQGDEYENSTKHQDEMYAYMEALRALSADRSDAVSGQENTLIRDEIKYFTKLAKEGGGPAPELLLKLFNQRDQYRLKADRYGSLRGIVAEIRSLLSFLEFQENSGRSRAATEMLITQRMLQKANQMMSEQTKTITGLEQEVAHIRKSMNARLEYYKALQKISDTVRPYLEDMTDERILSNKLADFIREENVSRNKCSSLEARQRYLMHLKNESVDDSTPRICTICQSEFEIGAITSCGHVFCKEDLQLWYSAHGNCPVCKRKLRSADFFDVTYKPSEMMVQAESSTPESNTSISERSINSIYSDISQRQLDEIKNIEIRGASFGSKVDTICRHLQWLRDQDPGSKTIIFSQFREVLDVLGRAFKQNKLTFTKCDDKDGISKFKSDPAIECFLLHAKAHSAGLNLVIASHVILCEPLINTAIELQAIARVHRIGQHRATTVWMYLIADTVEESIYEISVQRRLAHIKSRDDASRSGTQTPTLFQESVLDAANSKELQGADLSKALTPGRAGGEMVGNEDLWPCLFGYGNRKSRASEGAGMGSLEQDAESMPADGPVGRFLRHEAAVRRRDG